MKRFLNELQVPEKIYRRRLQRLILLQELGSPKRTVADAAWTLTQSFKPAPAHVKVGSWLYENLPKWLVWLLSPAYRKQKRETADLEKIVDELDQRDKLAS